MTDERNRNETDERLARLLDADEPARLLRPMWAEVERRRARAGGFDVGLATATAAAVTVGFLIGALTFNGNGEVPAEDRTADLAAVASSTVWTDAGPRIDQLYLLEEPVTLDEGSAQ